jgi:hypothetical protein
MIRLARLLLGVAGLSTLLLLPTFAELRPLSGPDAMGLVVVLAVMAARWISLAFAWGVAAHLGRVPWLAAGRAGQAAGVLLFHAAAGAASFGSLVLVTGPDSNAVRPWAWLFMLGIPLFSMAAVGAALTSRWERVPARFAKPAAAAMAVLVVWGGVSLWLTDRARAADTRAQQEATARDRQRLLDERLAALRTAAASAPFPELLRWLDGGEVAIVEEAARLIRARPTLTRDLAAMLAGPDAIRALRYVHLWMPGPPSELAVPAHDAIARWASSPMPSEGVSPSPEQACESVVAVATGFSSAGPDFATPMRAALRALDAHGLPEDRRGEDRTQPCRDYLRAWLDGRR